MSDGTGVFVTIKLSFGDVAEIETDIKRENTRRVKRGRFKIDRSKLIRWSISQYLTMSEDKRNKVLDLL